MLNVVSCHHCFHLSLNLAQIHLIEARATTEKLIRILSGFSLFLHTSQFLSNFPVFQRKKKPEGSMRWIYSILDGPTLLLQPFFNHGFYPEAKRTNATRTSRSSWSSKIHRSIPWNTHGAVARAQNDSVRSSLG